VVQLFHRGGFVSGGAVRETDDDAKPKATWRPFLFWRGKLWLRVVEHVPDTGANLS
jgi:hypothetical protein